MGLLLFALLLQLDLTSIEGSVQSSVGEPLKRAHVTLIAHDGRPGLTALTDSSGYYAFRELGPGSYHLWAEKEGFLRQDFGQKRPGRPPRWLNLTKGLRLQDINFKLVATGVIAGRVTDDEGERLPRVIVSALQFRFLNGKRTLTQVLSVSTNDLGEYRLFGLVPGRYYVSARTQSGGRGVAYGPVVYPNGYDLSQATPVDVRAGTETPGYDFRLSPARTVTLLVKVSASRQFDSISVDIVPKAGLLPGAFKPIPKPGGVFEQHHLPPGRYELIGTAWRQGVSWTARAEAEVSGGLNEPVILTFTPAISFTGRIRLEDASAEFPIGLSVLAGDVQTNTGAKASVIDKRFTMPGLPPSDYWVDVQGLPKGSYVKSIGAGRENLADQPLSLSTAVQLDIVISSKAAEVAGTVVHDGAPYPNATVALVPEGSRRGRISSYRTVVGDKEGQFTFHTLAPGDYKILAFEYLAEGRLHDPDFLAKHESRGKKITLVEGARDSLSVDLIPDAEPF